MMRFLLVGFAALLAACQAEPAKLEFSGNTMGTTYNIVAIDKTAKLAPDTIKIAIEKKLVDINKKLSNWDPKSEISRFNSQKNLEPFPISEDLAHVIESANAIHRQSEGQFDITLGPLIELWGFGRRDSNSHSPSKLAIRKTLEKTGQSTVIEFQKNPATMSKLYPDATVYLAAIAKGYGVDQLGSLLQERGINDYLVEIGGDLIASGYNTKGEPWRIGVERPDAGDHIIDRIINVSGLGMATSGDYRNYYEENGIRYSHIINAKTGRPITHTTASVTVLAESAMLADAWATALMVIGHERGLALSEKLDLAVMFISRNKDDTENRFTSHESSRYTALTAPN